MATVATNAGPTAPPTAYPSDDEILGIVDESPTLANPPGRSFGANAASRPNAAGRDAQNAPQDDVNFTRSAPRAADSSEGARYVARSQGVATSRDESASIPEWIERVSAADPEAAPELATLWQRSSALETFDRAVYGGDASAREQLITRLYSDDPAALRALVTTAQDLLFGAGRIPVARSIPSADVDARSQETPSEPKLRATDPGAERDRAANIERTSREQAPTAQFSPAAYAQFEQSTNDAVITDVGRAIERALDRTLPQGIADGARKRIAGDTLAEVHAALRGDTQLAAQVAAALSGSRFDHATRDQIARLIASRARGVVPEAARRVISEWTGSVLASHRERTARTQANTARVDVIGGALPQATPRRAAKSSDINYRATSDEDILSW